MSMMTFTPLSTSIALAPLVIMSPSTNTLRPDVAVAVVPGGEPFGGGGLGARGGVGGDLR